MKSEYRRQLGWLLALALVFAAVGAVMIFFGFRKFNDSRGFKATASSAEGTVTGFEMYDAPGIDPREDIHYAMVRFTPEGGEAVEFRGPSRDGPVRLDEGDTVDVLYDPEDPTDARVDSFMGLWFAATMLWVVGGGAVLAPLLTFWQAWKWAERQG